MKDKFLQFIESLKSSMAEMQTRVNEQIATLPPVEQHEAAGMISSIKAELSWQLRRVKELAESEVVVKADEIMAAFQKEVINDAITAGIAIAKDAHEAQIEAARNGGILAGREEAVLLATRRSEITSVLGENHGLVISDEQLTGEGFAALLSSMKDAVAKATESNFTLAASPKSYASIIAAAFNGADAVTAIIATLSEVRGPVKVESAANPPAIVAGAKPEAETTGFTFKKSFTA